MLEILFPSSQQIFFCGWFFLFVVFLGVFLFWVCCFFNSGMDLSFSSAALGGYVMYAVER